MYQFSRTNHWRIIKTFQLFSFNTVRIYLTLQNNWKSQKQKMKYLEICAKPIKTKFKFTVKLLLIFLKPDRICCVWWNLEDHLQHFTSTQKLSKLDNVTLMILLITLVLILKEFVNSYWLRPLESGFYMARSSLSSFVFHSKYVTRIGGKPLKQAFLNPFIRWDSCECFVRSLQFIITT